MATTLNPNSRLVRESLRIAEGWDVTWGGGRTVPADPRSQRVARWLEKSGLATLIRLTDGSVWNLEWTPEGLKALGWSTETTA